MAQGNWWALEKTERYWEASLIYAQQNNKAKVLECLGQVDIPLNKSFLWMEVHRLIEFFRRDDGAAIEVIEKYFPIVEGHDDEKLRIQCGIIKKLAHSSKTPDSLSPYLRERYSHLVDLLSSRTSAEWGRLLTIREFGRALETIGESSKTLSYYDQFASSPDPTIRIFARRRWIANKQKQVERLQKDGQEFLYIQTQKELHEKTKPWNISPSAKLPSYASLDDDEVSTDKGISGLPTGTEIESLAGGIIKLMIGQIEIKVDRGKKRISLEDTESWERLIVDFDQRSIKCSSDRFTSAKIDADRSTFSVPSSRYNGRTFFGSEDQRMEIEFQGTVEMVLINI